jgi:His-Xaa-Ser system protein HxsD
VQRRRRHDPAQDGAEEMDKHLFTVDKSMFRRSVVLRACHAFLDKCYVELAAGDDKDWHVTLQCKGERSARKEELEGEFRNSLINEAFRDALMERAQATKDLIVAKALFGADVTSGTQNSDALPSLDSELDDYEADPLGIAIPWEEKYGTTQKEERSKPAEMEPRTPAGSGP